LLAAAKTLGLETRFLDLRKAWSSSRLLNRMAYRFAGKRPARLGAFGRDVTATVCKFRPDLMLVTGISAPDFKVLRGLRGRGVRIANFLTDDPWNPHNAAGFFWRALQEYDVVFSPRRANLDDLRHHGCRRVEYLPFGYNPAMHFPESPATPAECERFECDVAFVGGADNDRLPIGRALVQAGLKVRLYGGYWDRDRELRPHWRGFVKGRDLRLAVCSATVNICLGRKANRDGHAMRSLELPAMGACLVVEDTLEHRELFGEDGECVVYFRCLPELVALVQRLCREPERARQLGVNVQRRICEISRHTYADRISSIMAVCR
jgi:spore maturation protein CgeB